MQRRLERFDAKLAQSGLDALLVTGQNNIYYLTDFWGTNATVFITKNRRLFLTDSRYTLIAKQSVHGFDIIESDSQKPCELGTVYAERDGYSVVDLADGQDLQRRILCRNRAYGRSSAGGWMYRNQSKSAKQGRCHEDLRKSLVKTEKRM